MKSPNDYNDSKALRRTKVKCHLCNYEWTTLSDAMMVTCPSCIRKTERKVENEEKL